MSAQRPAPDQAQRDAAIQSRGVNVLVDAGAGTGKTTLLVARLVEMVAPSDDAQGAVSLERIAAVTFTRKAAGELKLRVREKLLSELAGAPSARRRDRLAHALSAADTAFIGTIHGFADRLLRRRPVEARLSPSYEIVEDATALTYETFEILLQASEAGRLVEELAGTACPPGRAKEAQECIRTALAAEVRAETKETAWRDRHGLDALFDGFILHRDVPPVDGPPARFPAARVGQAIEEFVALARASKGTGKGPDWMRRAVRQLEPLVAESDPVTLYREVARFVRSAPRFPDLQMRRDFPGDPDGWEAWKAWGKAGAEPTYEERITAPLHRWMATRLVRTFPAVVAAYEKVKARHRAVDQVDLLLCLRDLLRSRRDVRLEMQSLFDHVFVDEFQDTDPLQAEIVLYLCEEGAVAEQWGDVRLAAGKLTLVGDPKQSIYRFRRADISVYDAVRAIVVKGRHLAVALTANFRSQPALIAHLNARFDEILGRAEPGKADFDPDSGTVVNRPLDAGREGDRTGCVVVLPFSTEDEKVGPDRAREATVLATWLRTLEGRGFRYGDAAILAHVTTNLGLLTDELDRLGVPWTARGASLFLQDPIHRQFLLALRALADARDGVATAALLREPFFAVDLSDLVRAGAAGDAPGDPGIERARAAQALVGELRRRRLDRPPGETARDLLERTGIGRTVAFGPNGPQRLGRLRELCFELERIAAAEGLDFDGVTAHLRAWALDPVGLDPPRPVGAEAVQIMSIHQAKGLEFPVVAWWDAHARFAPRQGQTHWFVERTGSAWALDIDGLSWQEPEESGFLGREEAYAAAERRRLVYVAATRAREILVLPVVTTGKSGLVTPALAGTSSPALDVLEEWTDDTVPAWATDVEAPPARVPREVAGPSRRIGKEWASASADSGTPRFVPKGVSTEAHERVDAEPEGDGRAGERPRLRESRFGRVFGDTVHRAIGLCLREPGLDAARAAERVAGETGLAEHLAEAAGDVTRTLSALEAAGMRRVPGDDLRLEYPVAQGRDGLLLQGYVDLLGVREGQVSVVDFKTDSPPTGDVRETHPAYVEQVRSYGRMLVELGVAKAGAVRCGLLFTADEGMHWV
jgi:ATP-dependent exoDNAse (exonuclease V) beta subunit